MADFQSTIQESNTISSRQIVPFRIRIGVTGHRHLTNPKIITQRVVEFFKTNWVELFDVGPQKIMSSLHHTPLAFVIITALAEGADQLVSKEILKIPNSRLDVVLPMTIDDCLKDFADEESRREFMSLVEQTRSPLCLRKQNLEHEFDADTLPEARKQAYETAGKYVVDHCDLLVALWDGQPARGQGGTADTVKYAKAINRPLVIISTNPPYAIQTEAGHGLSIQALKQIEAFNSFPIPEARQRSYVQEMYNFLFNNHHGAKIPSATKELIRDYLLPAYTRASIITKSNQKMYRQAAFLTYFLSVIAVSAIAFSVFAVSLANYAFLLEFVLLMMVLILTIRTNRKKTHQQWIENRFLTERIRSAIFFAACGVEVSQIDIPLYMLTAHRTDDWTIRTFYEIWNLFPRLTSCCGASCQIYCAFVQEVWIQKQIDFHKTAATKNLRISRSLERGGIGIFVLAMLVALVHYLFPLPGRGLISSGWEKVIVFLATILPAGGAAMSGIRTHLEYSRIGKRSGNMVLILKELKSHFTEVSTPAALESLLRQTEELMLRESQEWLMLLRFVELKPGA
jgi:hypothetical protein